ncbi:MAG: helix-turn-helix domain-containing protein [Bacteroidales bacterium]|nr:helix-turn-helix domain-containing protein [Bacteroidales bacterium]
MSKEITFDKLPQAVTYLTEQVEELKQLVSGLEPPKHEKHRLIGIDEACRIIQKAKPTVYTLVRKGLLPSCKKGKKLYFYEDELLEWIENGRRNITGQDYDGMLAAMQKSVRRKPKSGFNL